MTNCALSKHQKDLLRTIVGGLTLQDTPGAWWIKIAHDHGQPVWQGIEDDALRARLQAETTLADVETLERCGFLSNPQAGRYELYAQRVIELVGE